MGQQERPEQPNTGPEIPNAPREHEVPDPRSDRPGPEIAPAGPDYVPNEEPNRVEEPVGPEVNPPREF